MNIDLVNIDLENQIENLETNIYQMERKNNYIKNMLKNFIEIAKSYKLIDKEQTGLQCKLSKSIKDIKDITLAGLIIYKIVTLFVFLLFFLLEKSKSYCYIYFIFENWFFFIIFYESLSLFKKNNVVFEPEVESIIVKESREKIGNINTEQNYLRDLIET